MKIRCFGNKPGQEFYAKYHDEEWGVPVHDDVKLFEMLILEGAQAGLSWETILKKRAAYHAAFHDFCPKKCAMMTDDELNDLLSNSQIVRNRLKVYSVRRNAKIFLEIQKEFGSFDFYVWRFVSGKTQVNQWHDFKEVPSSDAVSENLSKDLKKRGMNFVGPTIIYAFMQAVGMVNDHLTSCPKFGQ